MVQIVFYHAHSYSDGVQLSCVLTDCVPQRSSNNVIHSCSVGLDGAKHISRISNGVDDHDDDDDDGYDDYDIDYDDDDDDDEEDKFHLEGDKHSRRLNSQLLRGYYDRRNRNHPNYRHQRCRKRKYGNGYRVSCRRIRRPVRRQ